MKTITIQNSKSRLITLWFPTAGFLILLFFIQTLLGRYENSIPAAWGWLSASIMPSVFHMMNAFFVHSDGSKLIRKSIYNWAFYISLFYLLLLVILVLSQPFITTTPIKQFQELSIALGVIQGGVNVSIGFFFSQSGT